MTLRYINTHYFPPTALPATFLLSGFVIDELAAMSLLVSIFVGREASLRGIRGLVAYGAPLLLASVFTGIAQWYLRQALGFQVVADVMFGSSSLFGKEFNMVYIGLDTLIYGAFIMLVYVSRLHEIECVEKTRRAELERANLEREISHSKLAEAHARLEPADVLAQIGRIKRLYEEDSPAAETALDSFAYELRVKLDGAAAAATLRAGR